MKQTRLEVEVIGLLLLKIDLLSFLIRDSVKYTKYKQWNIKRYDIKDYMWPLPPGLYLLIVSHGDFENESELRDHLVILTSCLHQRSEAQNGVNWGISLT